MRAVVTGGAGFIGSHLVDRLRADGWDVLVIDSASGASVQGMRATWGELPPVADAIYHLASPVGPVGVLGWAGRLVEEVVETTAIVRDWAFGADCPLIDVSTSEVYGSGKQDSEADSCHFAPEPSARKEYAVAKLAAETMLLNTPDLDVRIVRPFNVAGPRQKPDGGFVLPRFVQQAIAGEPITVYAPGTQRRAFTHVLDIVDGLVRAYEFGRAGEVYNLGNPDNATTICDLAAEVKREVGSDSPITVVDPVALHGPAFREAPDKLPNADKARDELDWRPTRDRLTTIRDVIEWAA